MKKLSSCLLACVMLLLSGCKDDTLSDLQAYISNVKKMTSRNAEAVSQVNVTPTFYVSAQEKSPFSFAKTPTMKRRKQSGPLEKYALSQLTLVGTIGRGKKSWALITTPNGHMHQQTMGTYIGLNHGRITKIMPKYIEVVEEQMDENGELEVSQQTLHLSTSKNE